MQFLKKNYEKILLAAVALAALGVVAFLPILVSQEKQKLDDLMSSYIKTHRKEFPPLDLKKEQALLQRAQNQITLDLVNPHRLFNPVRWQLAADGHVFPNPAGTEIDKLDILSISNLNFVISFVSASVTPGLPTHYGIGLTHEGALMAHDRIRKTTYVPLNETTNGFTVVSAEGPPEDPTSLTLQLSDTDESVSISKDRPYKRVEGHTVDLWYPPEKKNFPPNRRVGDTISFAGEAYKIIDIKESEVVLLQQSNQKQWIKKFSLTNSSATASP